MRYTVTALALAATVLLGGCGQIGPLYEPQENSLQGKAAQHNPQQTTAA